MRKFYKAPALIDISITNRCNLNCDFCYASSSSDESKKEEVSLKRLNKLFKELSEMNVHRISLTGGEPLIREDFFQLLHEIQQYEYAKIINTNATIIDKYIAQELSKYRVDRICISIDGSNEFRHNAIRGDGTFKKTLNGILEMQRFDLNVSTLFTLHNNNVNDLIDTIKLNEKLGIKYMSVMVVCPTGRASSGKLKLTPEKWYPVFNRLTDMKKANEIKLNFKIVPPNESAVFWLFYFPLEYYNRLEDLSYWNQDLSKLNGGKREISCQAGIKACSIAYNGDVYGCDLMMGMDKFLAGNIKDDSFNNIWLYSETFNMLRDLDIKKITGKCAECDFKWCGAGCRSSAYNLTGDILGSDEICFYKGCEMND